MTKLAWTARQLKVPKVLTDSVSPPSCKSQIASYGVVCAFAVSAVVLGGQIVDRLVLGETANGLPVAVSADSADLTTGQRSAVTPVSRHGRDSEARAEDNVKDGEALSASKIDPTAAQEESTTSLPSEAAIGLPAPVESGNPAPPEAVPAASSPALVEASAPPAIVPGSPAQTAAQPLAANKSASSVTHKVAKGDTITSIANKYKISPDTIIASNRLERSPDKVMVGQELVFPVPALLHVAVAGDTVASVARLYSADANLLASANALSKVAVLDANKVVIVPGGEPNRSGANAEAQTIPIGPPAPVGEALTSPQQPSTQDTESNREPSTRGTANNIVQPNFALDPNASHWAFIGSAIEPAQASQRETGVPASVTIAQAIHESAWGTSLLTRKGFNYFGIKAQGKGGSMGVITMNTGEHIGGVDVTVSAGFRAYRDMTESFIDHGHFFQENSRYAKAMASTSDARAFIRLIAQAGYATDPAYTNKVLAYMDKYNLYQYDNFD